MRQKYASPAFVIVGDFNQTNKQWVSTVLDLRQAVAIPTHQSGSILDLILTNLAYFYNAPQSLGPLQNSDHLIIFWEGNSAIPKTKRVNATIRPPARDSISTLGRSIGNYGSEDICSKLNSKLNSLLQENVPCLFLD